MNKMKLAVALSAASLLAACGSDSDDNGVNYPSTYEFSSKVTEGESSVVFTGQAARQLLIGELKNYAGKQAGADSTADKANMETIYKNGVDGLKADNIYGADSGFGTPVYISKPDNLSLAQADYTAVESVSGSKNLEGKLAGCDNDLSMNKFIGWTVNLQECNQNEKDDSTAPEVLDYNDAPHSLVLDWIEKASTNPVDESLGHDYAQLLQKFLLGAVTFSQTAEDYLKPTKGLLKQNTAGDKNGEKAYTALEHQWDEGFGYFGASLDYLSIDDATIASDKIEYSDVDGDTNIDLMRGEYNYGLAVYASKHDAMTGTTDLSKEIMTAFLEGRQLIQDNFGTDPVEGTGYHAELTQLSNTAVKGMEKVIAISVIKYINQSIDDLDTYTRGASNNDVSSLAKHWSELKGFALGLQFSPISTLTEAELVTLNDYIGESPITKVETENDSKADYIAELEAARTLVQQRFGFDATAVTQWGR